MLTVYHSDRLPLDYPTEFLAIQSALGCNDIPYLPIPGTRDVWCRDYMPVQAANGDLFQFVYWPRYLRDPKHAGLITSPTCYRTLPFAGRVRTSDIILDGGAIEICGKSGLVTERVFEDNPRHDRLALLDQLRESLSLERLLVLPVEPGDETGHVDGVVRFVNEYQVVMNNYAPLGRQLAAYGQEVEHTLRANGIAEISLLPYAPSSRKGPSGMPVATGCYANFLKVGNALLLPQFGIPADEQARAACEQIFQGAAIEKIDCRDLAKEGGVLNCVSWMRGADLDY